MTDPRLESLPSSARLLRATLVAVAVAGLLLVTVVMPAEFGRDPLGAGRALGLYRPAADCDDRIAGDDRGRGRSRGVRCVTSPSPFRSDEMTVTLESGEGIEIKAAMSAGERMVFSWTASGGEGVDVDMHGEATGGAGRAVHELLEGRISESRPRRVHRTFCRQSRLVLAESE